MKLIQVEIGVDSLTRTVPTYEAICDSSATWINDGQCRICFSDAELLLIEGHQHGVISIGFLVDNLADSSARLNAAGIAYKQGQDLVRVNSDDASGVEVTFTTSHVASTSNRAFLDHVALRVNNLESSTDHWSKLLGVPGDILGIHPVSNGAFSASRFAIGERMIELVSPVPGVASNLASRLASHGEGAVAVAIPSQDVTATRRLVEQSAKLIWQDPHWIVHPKDTGGILIQLTPRVAH